MRFFKNLLFCCFTVIFYNNILLAQCPQGDVTLTTQLEVDNFAADYPSCTEITGALAIGVYGITLDITDLSNMPPIESIGGSLRVSYNAGFTDLSGLENLTSIGGSLRVSYNAGFTDLSGLENLTSIGSHLRIFSNTALIDLSGLENLTSIGSYLKIDENPSLTDLSGLENLTSIGSHLMIDANHSLTDLSGLGNLTSIGGYLMRISSNAALTDLNGLENLTSIGSHLRIHNNPILSTCEALFVCGHLSSGGASLIHSNASGCNSATEILDACDALPIEALDKLQVYLKNKTAILEWRTATETNNAGFEIQRSKDGITWEKIGWQEGQGNTLTPHAYTYRDGNPFFGTSYYRFKQVDFNGDFKYSHVVSLQYSRSGITVFPNPNEGIFEVQSTAQGTYQILNTSGQIIQTGEMKNDVLIDISTQAQGVYFMSIQIENETITKRIIKM